MDRKKALVFIGIGILLISTAVVVSAGGFEEIKLLDLSLAGNSSANGGPEAAPEKGSLAPDFALELISGESVTLSDYQGKVVLLNFWAVWCPPCRQEMPSFQSIHERYGDEIVILGINAGDSRADAASFVQEFGLTFDILLDSRSEVEFLYRVRGLPTTFLIDPQGVIQILHIGYLEERQLMGYLSDMGIN